MIEFYKKMKPSAKIWTIRALAVFAMLLVGYPLFKSTTAERKRKEKPGEYKVLDSDAETFEKALYTKTKADIEALSKQIEELKESLEKKQQAAVPVPAKLNLDQADMEKLKRQVEKQLLAQKGKSGDVIKQQLFNNPPKIDTVEKGRISPQKTKLGIKTVKGIINDTKAGKDTILLPPSFMDASLLTGVIAPTTQVGQSHPIPMLIRVKDLAVLPNEVKEDLKGCFVIAEGSGDLSKERVDTRLLNLSCITNQGDAIIDQPVKGWVVDADGRAGLSGRVVAKFGTHIARVTVAGFLEGFGRAFEQTALDTTVNIVGGTTTTLKDSDTETVLKAGGGRAIVTVAEDLQKFYLQLAQQTLPVIEVGPTKQISVIISEGTELEIKERKKYVQK
jgi:conjugal transfer pilus assembly protein TraB